MPISRRLDGLIGLRPGEGPMIGLLFLQYFFTGSASALTQAAGFAMFLAAFNANQLPYTFMIMSVLISSVTTLYLQLGRFTGFANQLKINLLGQMLVTAGFAVGLGFGGRTSWLVFCLPVLFQIVIVFGNMAFWSLAGRMLNVQQGKRLFGVLGTGEWLAMVLMGLLVPVMVPWTGLANLLWLAVMAMGVALAIMTVNIRMHGHLLADAPAESGERPVESEKAPRLLDLLRHRYVLVIFCLTLLWWTGFFFVDNIFYAQAAIQYPQGEALAGFIGLYLSIVGVLTVISNLFVAGPVVSRLGLRWSLLALPAGLVAGALIMAATGLLSGPIAVLFVAAVATKIWSVGLGFSVDQAARSILVQPFSPGQRTRVQTLVDGVAQPISTGAAGLLLLALGALFPASLTPLIFGLLAAALAHVVVVELVSRGYVRALLDALRTRRLTGTELTLTDASSRAILVTGLDHPHPGAVTYAMRMLATADATALAQAIPRLLARPEPDIRRYAIEQAGELGLAELAPVLRSFVEIETQPDLRGAGLRALARLGDGAPALAHIAADGALRRAAIAGAIEAGASEGLAALTRLTASHDASDRLAAAEIAVEAPKAVDSATLLALLGDDDLAVRRTALRAAGRAADPSLWPIVVAAVADRATRNVAMAALVSGGASTLGAIKAALGKTDQTPETMADLARVVGRIGASEAVEFLLPLADSGKPAVRGAALAALWRCGYRVGSGDMVTFLGWVKAEAGFAAWASATLADLGDHVDAALPISAMRRHLAQSQRRMLDLLALAGDSDAVARAADNLRSGDGRKRSYALEVLDIATPVTLKPMVLPVLEELTLQERLQRLSAVSQQPRKDLSARLAELADNASNILDDWTQASAVHALSEIAPEKRAPLPAAAAQGVLMQDIMAALLDAVGQKEGGQRMLSTVEKVIMLRSAGIFTETADEVLADVAAITTDSTALPGHTILSKGEPGDSMYVIASGKVRVHDDGRTLAELGPGEPFGEMALIDPEPRSASVTAVEETRLLRIDQDAFFELVDERPEVARGLLRVLSRRLRNAN